MIDELIVVEVKLLIGENQKKKKEAKKHIPIPLVMKEKGVKQERGNENKGA